MATINRKTRNQLNLNSTCMPIRFHIKKLKHQYLKLWSTAHQIYKNKKNSVCVISIKSQIFF